MMSVESATTRQKRKRWRTWIVLAFLVMILGLPLWASNWFDQRARLLNQASDAVTKPHEWKWLSTMFGNEAPELFGEPIRLSFPRRVRLTSYQTSIIGGFVHLKALSAYGLDDDDMWRLRDLSDLETLNLHGAHISDEGMDVIAGFTKLKTLQIDAASTSQVDEISVDGWRKLVKLPSLKDLTLTSSGVTDAALKPLGQLSGLTHLQIKSPHVHGKGLRHLGGLKSLFYLWLNCPLDDFGSLSSLQTNTGLRVLNLGGNFNH